MARSKNRKRGSGRNKAAKSKGGANALLQSNLARPAPTTPKPGPQQEQKQKKKSKKRKKSKQEEENVKNDAAAQNEASRPGPTIGTEPELSPVPSSDRLREPSEQLRSPHSALAPASKGESRATIRPPSEQSASNSGGADDSDEDLDASLSKLTKGVQQAAGSMTHSRFKEVLDRIFALESPRPPRTFVAQAAIPAVPDREHEEREEPGPDSEEDYGAIEAHDSDSVGMGGQYWERDQEEDDIAEGLRNMATSDDLERPSSPPSGLFASPARVPSPGYRQAADTEMHDQTDLPSHPRNDLAMLDDEYESDHNSHGAEDEPEGLQGPDDNVDESDEGMGEGGGPLAPPLPLVPSSQGIEVHDVPVAASHDANAAYLQSLLKDVKADEKKRFNVSMSLGASRCTLELFKLPSTKYTAQTIVWQLLFIMGVRIEPFAAQTSGLIPTEKLRDIFQQLGHFPAFTEAEGIASDRYACIDKKPLSLSIFGAGIECTTCEHHHLDTKCTWQMVMMLGSGLFTDADLQRWATDNLHMSHKCGRAWCINPACQIIETKSENGKRVKCHSHRRTGSESESDSDWECEHSDPCDMSTKDLDFKPVYDRLQKTFKDFKRATDVDCPVEGCEQRGRGADVLYHCMKIHAKEQEPLRSYKELVIECPKCEAPLTYWKSVKEHEKKVKLGKRCTKRKRKPSKALDEGTIRSNGRGLIAGLDALLE